MKKQLFAIIFAITVAVSAYAQDSQAIRADIPFAFTVNERTLPAGIYRVESASDNRNVWKLQSTSQRLFVLANSLSGVSDAGHLRITFHRYGSQHYLAGFKTPSYQVSLRPSSSEKVLRRPTMNLSDYDAVTVEVLIKPTASY